MVAYSGLTNEQVVGSNGNNGTSSGGIDGFKANRGVISIKKKTLV